MKCEKCGHTVRCMRCGTAAPEHCGTCPGSRKLAGSIAEELRNHCMSIEVSKGLMRRVLLVSDVEEILRRLTCNAPNWS